MESAFAVMAWTVAILLVFLVGDFIIDQIRERMK